jgi:hypothetical protein
VPDPVAQRCDLEFRERRVLGSTTERGQFQIFHLVLHKAEQRAGVGFTWNNRGLTTLTAFKKAREASKIETSGAILELGAQKEFDTSSIGRMGGNQPTHFM